MRQDAHFDDDGRLTSTLYGDIYFSGDGVSETEHVFVLGNDLVERFKATTGTFVIGETGFGTGLNFLVAAQCFSRHAPAGARLVFVSTEQHPLTKQILEAAHAQLPKMLQGQARELRAALAEGSKQDSHQATFNGDRISLHLLLGDATESLRSHAFTADAWFLDGFSPARNPAMWSFELLREVANQTACNGTFATYTVAGQVRRNLQDAGFNIERQPGFGKKREMLCGTRKAPAKVDSARRLVSATGKRLARVQVHGAGIAGATIAHAFAERGVAVTVIDPHGVAAGASGIQAAIVRPRLWVAGPGSTPDAEIIAQAFRFTTDWLNKVDNGRFRQCGAMLCAVDAEDQARLKQRCMQRHQHSLWSRMATDGRDM
jgi:tRNA 5-methylaminomethyl-2-thiouridine biosynthesis bifunctional protein